jgi:hypothetical protein
MLDYMSTSRISPPPFREVRFLLADADYVGDSPCHSFIGFGPGSLGHS